MIADCLDNLNYFPAIQQLCQKIQDTEDLQFDQAFGNYSAQIKTEINLFESSL